MNLLGTYECKLDEKGRVSVPAALKKQLSPYLKNGFLLKRSLFHPCLELYSAEEWTKIMDKLNRLNRFVKRNNDFIRKFTAGVKQVRLDSNNRFLVAKDLLEFAGIEREIVLSSAINILEIWDKNKYEKAITEDDDLIRLAEEIMGKD